jgi:hypothetical protein
MGSLYLKLDEFLKESDFEKVTGLGNIFKL